LRDHAGVAVGSGSGPQSLAQCLAGRRIDSVLEEQPMVGVTGRGLDREANRRGRGPGHGLVAVAVDDLGDHGDRIGELATLLASQSGPYGTGFDVDVVPILAGVNGILGHSLDERLVIERVTVGDESFV
jgi:hypothetical protein